MSNSGKTVVINEQFLNQFVDNLGLSTPQAIILALSLLLHTSDTVQSEGAKFLTKKLTSLSSSASTLPDGILHNLLVTLQTDPRLVDTQKVISDVLTVHSHAASMAMMDPVLADMKERDGIGTSISPYEVKGRDVTGSCSLVQLVRDFGPSAFSSKEILSKIICRFNSAPGGDKLVANDVAQLLGLLLQFNELSSINPDDLQMYLVTTFVKGAQVTKLDERQSASDYFKVFIDVVHELAPSIRWSDVIKGLDCPQFHCPNSDGLRIIVAVHNACTADPFPYDVLISPWVNTAGQLSVLVAAIQSTTDKTGKAPFNFTNLGPRAHVFSGLTTPLRPVQEPWTHILFVETLLRLAECESYSVVKKLFESPILGI